MFDVLFNAEKAERHPIEMFFVGLFYSTLSILLSLWIFKEHASLVMVFLTVLSCIYVFQSAIKIEESKEKEKVSEKKLLREHSKMLLFFMFLFLGFVVSFSVWTIFLPYDTMNNLFNLQESIVKGIRSATGNVIVESNFQLILINNLKVLFIALLFAFFYGAGAIFILAWNASVVGFVIGNITRSAMNLVVYPMAFTRYLLHGTPEFLAYFVAALAGGIIYVAIITGDKKKIKRIAIDSVVLVLISILLLIIAAVLEVYVSPLI